MGVPLLTDASHVLCPHAAPAQVLGSQSRVLILGRPIALFSDNCTVAGCPMALTPNGSCQTLSWLQPAQRVRVNGVPVLLETSIPMGAGVGTVTAGQNRVVGS